MALFKERQEQFAHVCSLKWAIFSERAKSEWAKELNTNTALYPDAAPGIQVLLYRIWAHILGYRSCYIFVSRSRSLDTSPIVQYLPFSWIQWPRSDTVSYNSTIYKGPIGTKQNVSGELHLYPKLNLISTSRSMHAKQNLVVFLRTGLYTSA